MKEKILISKSIGSRNKKTRAILRSATENSLNNDELDAILCGMAEDRLYCLRVHHEPRAFLDSLTLRFTPTRSDCGAVILGSAYLGLKTLDGESKAVLMDVDAASAAVVEADTAPAIRYMHIYVPIKRIESEELCDVQSI